MKNGTLWEQRTTSISSCFLFVFFYRVNGKVQKCDEKFESIRLSSRYYLNLLVRQHLWESNTEGRERTEASSSRN